MPRPWWTAARSRGARPTMTTISVRRREPSRSDIMPPVGPGDQVDEGEAPRRRGPPRSARGPTCRRRSSAASTRQRVPNRTWRSRRATARRPSGTGTGRTPGTSRPAPGRFTRTIETSWKMSNAVTRRSDRDEHRRADHVDPPDPPGDEGERGVERHRQRRQPEDRLAVRDLERTLTARADVGDTFGRVGHRGEVEESVPGGDHTGEQDRPAPSVVSAEQPGEHRERERGGRRSEVAPTSVHALGRSDLLRREPFRHHADPDDEPRPDDRQGEPAEDERASTNSTGRRRCWGSRRTSGSPRTPGGDPNDRAPCR